MDSFPFKIVGIFIFVRSCPNNFVKYFRLFTLLVDTLSPKVTITSGKRINYENLSNGQKKIPLNSLTNNSADIELVVLLPNNCCGRRENLLFGKREKLLSVSPGQAFAQAGDKGMGGWLLHSGNDMIRLFPCKMQFCLDMHVWKDKSYANHVRRHTVIPCK